MVAAGETRARGALVCACKEMWMSDQGSPDKMPLAHEATVGTMREQVQADIQELRALAKAFGLQRLRDGTWFNEFVRAMLGAYAERIMSEGGVEYFRKRYPGRTRDGIAEEVVDLAVKYATVAGAASGAASSAAFAATIGTAGGAAVVGVPVAATTIGAELLWTTRLQLRMVYDLATVYGQPIDTDDPTDLYRAFMMAFGINVAASGGATAKVFGPEVARSAIRGVIHGHTPLIQQAAIRVVGPRIGRQITQRAILRSAVPVAGTVIGGAWNRVTTEAIGAACRHDLRTLGRIRDAVLDLGRALGAQSADVPLVVETMLVIIAADGVFDDREREVFARVVDWLNVPRDVLTSIEDRADIHLESLAARLGQLQGDDRASLRTTLAACMRLVAASEGRVTDSEVAVLRRLYAAIGEPLDLDALARDAEFFCAPEGLRRRLSGGARDAARRGAEAGADVRAMASKLGRRLRLRRAADGHVALNAVDGDVEAADTEPTMDEDTGLESYDAVVAKIRKLAEMHADGIVDDSEFQAKKTELLAQLA